MRLPKRLPLISMALTALVTLSGFNGPEKYIELGAALYGRSSSEFFYGSRDNIETVLPQGTRGEIVDRKKLESGNYGYEVQVLNGENAGKKLWVFYNMDNPDMTLYSRSPRRWSETEKPEPAASVESAEGMKAIRDTVGIKAPAAQPAPKPEAATPAPPAAKKQPELTATDIQIRESFRRISKANQEMRHSTTAPCVECSLPTTSGRALHIGRGSKGMDAACSALMNSQGQMGPTGRALMSIMSERQYKSYFLRNDSLGRFCPKFRYLTPSEKMQAWVWFWTALAQEESSCDPHMHHGTRYRDRQGRWARLNPREGYGLWTMEKDANIRRGRGAPCANISTAAGQARCTVEIMTATQLAHGRKADVYSGSYWGPIMRGDRQIMPHMRRLNICF